MVNNAFDDSLKRNKALVNQSEQRHLPIGPLKGASSKETSQKGKPIVHNSPINMLQELNEYCAET